MTRLVAADIGGTKTLLRCVEEGAEPLDARYDSHGYETFDAVLREFMERVPGPVDAACIAVAGPVLNGRAHVTNAAWDVAADEIASAFPSIGKVSVINDFYAAALGVPLLESGDLISLQKGTREAGAPIAVLGAGTGLGQAIVVNGRDVLPTEAGHADFAPQDEEQTRLFLHLRARHGHVSWDRVAYGPGLVNIFTFLGGEECEPAEIAERADRGERLAARAFEIFVDAYGSEAGNVALRILARGGVYLAGGIAAKNILRFTDGRFMSAFVRKGRMRALAETIPVDLIAREDVGLIGAIECAWRSVSS